MMTERQLGPDEDGPAPRDSGIFGFDVSPEDAAVVLVPVPFDAATSWGRGAAEAPAAICAASHQIDLFDPYLGEPYRRGIALLEHPAPIQTLSETGRKAADASRELEAEAHREALVRVDEACKAANDWVYGQVDGWLSRGKLIGIVGGDHATAYGSILAHLERFPNMGVLQIDAHADLRRAYEGFTWSHASVMHNVLENTGLAKLAQVGLRDVCRAEIEYARARKERIISLFDRDIARHTLAGEPFECVVQPLIDALPDEVYVSFDIDGLDRSLCPNTGTPVPGGLSFHQACALLEALDESGRRIVGFDLVEVAPGPPPHESSWDATVGAHLLYRLCGHALKST